MLRNSASRSSSPEGGAGKGATLDGRSDEPRSTGNPCPITLSIRMLGALGPGVKTRTGLGLAAKAWRAAERC